MSRYVKVLRIIRHAQTKRNLELRKSLRDDPWRRGWMTRGRV